MEWPLETQFTLAIITLELLASPLAPSEIVGMLLAAALPDAAATTPDTRTQSHVNACALLLGALPQSCLDTLIAHVVYFLTQPLALKVRSL